MLPHIHVHRRSNNHRSFGRKVQRGEKVVGDALCKLGDRIGRRRSYQQRVNRLRHRNVLHRGVEVRAVVARGRTFR